MRIARVFPRRTRATPDDALAFNGPPGLFAPDVDAVHISVTFSWDLPASRALALEWERVAPVTVGGPAIGSPSAEFTPGLYLKRGYVITSVRFGGVRGGRTTPGGHSRDVGRGL